MNMLVMPCLLYEYVLSRLPEVVNLFPVITTVKHFQAAALRVNTVKNGCGFVQRLILKLLLDVSMCMLIEM